MGKRLEKTEQTKAYLEEAFWRLYEEKPIERISIQEIVDTAGDSGYNRGTFYLHFKDIYDLLETIESRLLEDMTNCVQEAMSYLAEHPGKMAKLKALEDVVRCYRRNKRYLVLLLGVSGQAADGQDAGQLRALKAGPQGDPTFVLRLKEALKPLWREYVLGEEATARTPGEMELLLEYTLSGTLYMVGKWLVEPAGVSAPEMGHLVYDLAIQDLSARARE